MLQLFARHYICVFRMKFTSMRSTHGKHYAIIISSSCQRQSHYPTIKTLLLLQFVAVTNKRDNVQIVSFVPSPILFIQLITIMDTKTINAL